MAPYFIMTRFDQIQNLFKTIDPFNLSAKRVTLDYYHDFSFKLILMLNQFETEHSIKFKIKHLLFHLDEIFYFGNEEFRKTLIDLIENDLRVNKLVLEIKEILGAPEGDNFKN